MATPKKTTETAQLAKEGTSAAKQEKTKAHMVQKSQNNHRLDVWNPGNWYKKVDKLPTSTG